MTQTAITPGSPGFFLLCLAGYSLLANFLAFAAFAVDQRRRRQGFRRVPEGTFLFIAAFGGWFGAALGQAVYAETRRMKPFTVLLNLCGMVLPASLALAIVAADPDLALQRAEALVARLVAPQPQGPKELLVDGSHFGTRRATAPRRFGPGTDAVPLFHN